jgi:hypothetical protein
MDLLPRDGDVNVSALVWQNLGPSLAPAVAKLAGLIDDQQIRDLNSFASQAKPSLVTLTAKDDRIIIGAQSEPGFGSMLGSVISVNQLGLLSNMLHESAAQHHDGVQNR